MTNLVDGGFGFAPKVVEVDASFDEKIQRTAVEAARRKFSPEFMNRLDKVVVFHPLKREELDEVLEIELGNVQKRVLDCSPRPFSFQVTSEGRKFLLQEGTDQRYGARHLKRAIERHVVYPLANLLATEQVHLTWFMWSGTEPEVVAWKHVAELVTQKYPDITVEFQTTSFPDYWTKLPALAAAHKLPDIVSLQSLRAPGFSSLMVPLDDRVARDKFDIASFDKSIVGGLSHDGKVFALPYDFGPLLIYYNADLFAKAGLPAPKAGWTVADFIKDAKALTSGSQYGYSLGGVDQVVAWAASAGAAYMKGDEVDLTLTKLHSDLAQAALLPAKAGIPHHAFLAHRHGAILADQAGDIRGDDVQLFHGVLAGVVNDVAGVPKEPEVWVVNLPHPAE